MCSIFLVFVIGRATEFWICGTSLKTSLSGRSCKRLLQTVQDRTRDCYKQSNSGDTKACISFSVLD